MKKQLLSFSILLTLVGCGFKVVNQPASKSVSQTTTTVAANPNCNKQVTLAWDPVFNDLLGNPIQVDGYKLYIGNQHGGPYTLSSIVNGSATALAEVKNLCPGTYYFVVTTFLGVNESEYSNEVSTVLPRPNIVNGQNLGWSDEVYLNFKN